MNFIKVATLSAVLLLALHDAGKGGPGRMAILGTGAMADADRKWCSKLCFKANNRARLCAGSNCPPCWYKEDDGVYSCYEYDKGTTTCPSFANPVNCTSLPTNIPVPTTGPPSIPSTTVPLNMLSSITLPPIPTPTNSTVPTSPPAPTGTHCPVKCYRGGMRDHPDEGINQPPCWYKESDGAYGCYDYIKGGGCPFEGNVTRPACP